MNRILDLGVTLEVDAKVADILSELAGGFDAAFVAVGAHIGRGAYIPVGEGCGLCATECPCGAIEMEPEQT